MGILHTIFTIIQVLCAVALVAIVMLQTGKGGMSSAIAGSSEGFMSKTKGAGKEAQLVKYTKIIAAVFLVLTFVLNLF